VTQNAALPFVVGTTGGLEIVESIKRDAGSIMDEFTCRLQRPNALSPISGGQFHIMDEAVGVLEKFCASNK